MIQNSHDSVNQIREAVHQQVEIERGRYSQNPQCSNGPEAPSCFSSLDFSRNSAARFLEEPPPPILWHFRGDPGGLRAGTFGRIVGDGGSGKGGILLQAGIATATPVPFLDGLFEVEDTARGKSVLIFGEDDNLILHHRFSKMTDSLVDSSAREIFLDRIRENLIILSVCGADVRLMQKSITGELSETDSYNRLLEKLTAIPDLRLVALDPQSRFYAGDEDSSIDSTFFAILMERICQTTGATVLVSHHTTLCWMREMKTRIKTCTPHKKGVRCKYLIITATSNTAHEYTAQLKSALCKLLKLLRSHTAHTAPLKGYKKVRGIAALFLTPRF
jgi:hypothetical protein